MCIRIVTCMKTTDEIINRFKNKQQNSERYALVNYEIRIKPAENQNFIVPWQMVESMKSEILLNEFEDRIF